jgi:hypothetical protein
MAALECARCLDLHGGGCTATHESEEGKPICVFCLDGEELCPVLRKREQAARKGETLAAAEQRAPDPTVNLRVRSNELKSEEPMETKSETTRRETHAPVAAKICKRPGCTTELGPKNESGKCAAHFHFKLPEERTSSAGNGHPAAGSNGAHKAGNGIEPKATNGNNGAKNGAAKKIETFPELAADRVDQLILNLPAAEKNRLALLWLTRAI